MSLYSNHNLMKNTHTINTDIFYKDYRFWVRECYIEKEFLRIVIDVEWKKLIHIENSVEMLDFFIDNHLSLI